MTNVISRPYCVALLSACWLGAWILPAGADEAAVAKIGNKIVSAVDLDDRAGAKLNEQREAYELHARQLKFNYDRDRQALLEKELSGLIDERVLSLEAAAHKTTVAAFSASIKAPPVSDADMHAFYDANRAQIAQPFEKIAPQMREFLEKRAKDTTQRAYLDSLRVKYKAVTTLDPARETVAATGPQRGSEHAPVTIVEFSDFQCPFCGRFAPVMQAVLKKYPTQVRLVYRNLPLTNLHANAEHAAEAGMCAADQGKFWDMHDVMFAEQSTLGLDALKEKAKRIGLNTATFAECLDSGKSRETVLHDFRAAEQLGLTGTPTLYINGRYLTGAVTLEELSSLIDDELRRVSLVAQR